MKNLSRRKLVKMLAAGGAGVGLTSLVNSDQVVGMTTEETAATVVQAERAFSGQHSAKALPFDPEKLKGLSEKLIKSHWENNYGGAVKALNAVEQRLASMLSEKDLP